MNVAKEEQAERQEGIPDFVYDMYTEIYPAKLKSWIGVNRPDLLPEFVRSVASLYSQEIRFFLTKYLEDRNFPKEELCEFLGHEAAHFRSVLWDSNYVVDDRFTDLYKLIN